MLSGTAWTGKSWTVRAIMRWIREHVARDLHLSGDAVVRAATLCAPTGCASFQMKYGAATVHRIFGIPVGLVTKMMAGTDRFKKLQARLKLARLFVMDEFCMIGRHGGQGRDAGWRGPRGETGHLGRQGCGPRWGRAPVSTGGR